MVTYLIHSTSLKLHLSVVLSHLMGPNKGDALSICPANLVEKLTNLSKSEQIKVTFLEPYSVALGF